MLSLPDELLWRISYFLTSPSGNRSTEASQDSETSNSDNFVKSSWKDVEGFSMASRALRDMTLRHWFRVLKILSEDDWEVYSEKYAFVFRYTTSVVWHGSMDSDQELRGARTFLWRFGKLRDVRVVLPVPGDFFLDIDYRPAFADYMKALAQCRTHPSAFNQSPIPAASTSQSQSSIRLLEIYYEMYPSPEVMRLIAGAVPNLEILRLRQPAVWCNYCFTCSIPWFADPRRVVGRRIVYEDGNGLPTLYASRLSPLSNLHTVEVTVGVENGIRTFDNIQDTYLWSGECHSCLSMMDNDEGFRETCLEGKRFDRSSDRDRKEEAEGRNRNRSVPSRLRKVVWGFMRLCDFEDDWTRVAAQLYG